MAPTLAVCGDVISLVVGEKAEQDHQVQNPFLPNIQRAVRKSVSASGWVGYKIFCKRENNLVDPHRVLLRHGILHISKKRKQQEEKPWEDNMQANKQLWQEKVS